MPIHLRAMKSPDNRAWERIVKVEMVGKRSHSLPARLPKAKSPQDIDKRIWRHYSDSCMHQKSQLKGDTYCTVPLS